MPGAALAALVLGTVALISRLHLLLDDAYPTGFDGYYYVLQLRSLHGGEPLFQDGSLIWIPLRGLHLLLGEPVQAMGWLGSLAAGLAVAGATLAGAELWGRASAGWISGSVWLLSQGHLALSAEYLKNGLGLGLLALQLALLARPTSGTVWAIAAGLSLLGLGVHKLTGVMGALALLAALAWRLRSGRRRELLAALLLLLLATATIGLLRPSDLSRLFTELAHPLDRLADLQRLRPHPGEWIELLATHLAPPLALLLAWRRPGPLSWALCPISLALLAPGLPIGRDLLSWRLLLMGFVPVGLLVGGLGRGMAGQALAVGLTTLALLLLPAQLDLRAARQPDYAGWVEAIEPLRRRVPAQDRVVAHRGLCGFVWAEADRRCENFDPPQAEGWWRIVYGFGSEHLAPYSEQPPLPLRPGYVLVDEAAWRAFRAAHAGRFRLLDDPRNPTTSRPDYVYGPEGPPPDPALP